MSKLQQQIDQIVKEADEKYTKTQKQPFRRRARRGLLSFALFYTVLLVWYSFEVGIYRAFLPLWLCLDPLALQVMVNGFAFFVALEMLRLIHKGYGVNGHTKLGDLPYGYLVLVSVLIIGAVLVWKLPAPFSMIPHFLFCLIVLFLGCVEVHEKRLDRQYRKEERALKARIQALVNNATPEEIAEAKRRCEICEQESKYDICLDCENKYRNERHRIRAQNARAKKQGLEANLTLRQWLDILKGFDFKCAYCQIEDAKAIEHYIPIDLGGGTTASNVLPSCTSCNSKKGHSHPER